MEFWDKFPKEITEQNQFVFLRWCLFILCQGVKY